YYSSVREDGLGYTDIYLVTTPEGVKDQEAVLAEESDPEVEPEPEPRTPVNRKPLRYVVTVVDAKSQTPVTAKVALQGLRDNVVVGSRQASPGVYEFNITHPDPKDYRLSVEKEGYAFINQQINLPGTASGDEVRYRTVTLQPLNVGTRSILRNIYFDYDKATFRTESYTELNDLVTMLRQNPAVKVEISGHTDTWGHWRYNRTLSQRRAGAVKDYLTAKGIDPRRIRAVGYGESRPIASNDDEKDGRELNRRVEFVVLQK